VSTFALEVPSTRHVTIDDRAFGIAAPRVWNTAGRRHVIVITACLQATSKNFLIYKFPRVTIDTVINYRRSCKKKKKKKKKCQLDFFVLTVSARMGL